MCYQPQNKEFTTTVLFPKADFPPFCNQPGPCRHFSLRPSAMLWHILSSSGSVLICSPAVVLFQSSVPKPSSKQTMDKTMGKWPLQPHKTTLDLCVCKAEELQSLACLHLGVPTGSTALQPGLQGNVQKPCGGVQGPAGSDPIELPDLTSTTPSPKARFQANCHSPRVPGAHLHTHAVSSSEMPPSCPSCAIPNLSRPSSNTNSYRKPFWIDRPSCEHSPTFP